MLKMSLWLCHIPLSGIKSAANLCWIFDENVATKIFLVFIHTYGDALFA